MYTDPTAMEPMLPDSDTDLGALALELVAESARADRQAAPGLSGNRRESGIRDALGVR
jgi:hypothetical protein